MVAVCHSCGGPKSGPFVPCKACSYTPSGEDRSVAWLFSIHHLDEDELAMGADRLKNGERPDPSKALREMAHEAMGAAPLPDGAKTPIPTGQVLLLALANLVLTPLAGFVVWLGLRGKRPVAARQALWVTLPISLATTLLWLGVMTGR